MLVAGVLVVAIVYMLADAGRRPGAGLDEPACATAGSVSVDERRPTTARHGRPRAMPPSATGSAPSAARRAASGGGCCAAARVHRRCASCLLFWVVCAVGGERVSPYGPLADRLPAEPAAERATTRSAPTQLGRDVLSRVMAGARDVLIVSPFAAAAERDRRHAVRARRRLHPWRRSTRSSAASWRRSWRSR